MKALIVDDQPVSRKKIQKILEGVCDNDSVDSGAAAINSFRKSLDEKKTFDIITLDISMPDMNGTEVLQKIRELESERGITKHRQVKILMITAASDKETVVACIKSGCDDYIVKPLNKEAIAGKFKKFGFNIKPEGTSDKALRQMVETAIKKFNKGQIELPVMPRVVQELQDIIRNTSSSNETIAEAIEKDIQISLRIIAAANSPLYRGTEKIENVKKAVIRIGLREITNIVNIVANKGLYETKNKQMKQLLDKLWIHSLSCGHAARLISEKVFPDFAPKAFMAGLVHDIGSVMLLKVLGDIVSSKTAIDEKEVISTLAETHADFGAALLKKWDFTHDLVGIASFHEWGKYNQETGKEVLIINLADNLSHKIGFGFYDKTITDLGDLDSTKLLGIDSGYFETICEKVTALTGDSKSIS